MPTDNDKLQMALAIFKHFSPIPEQVLLPYDFIAVAGTNDWRNLDVLDGVKAGYAKGFFVDGPNYGIKLTSDGFAAISALDQTSQNETTAVSASTEINQTDAAALNETSQNDTAVASELNERNQTDAAAALNKASQTETVTILTLNESSHTETLSSNIHDS